MSPRTNSTRVRRKVFHYWRYLTDHGWRMKCQCGCETEFNPATEKWEAHHDDKPHVYGGSDEPPAVKPLLYRCHREVSGKQKTFIAKGQRQSDSVYGVKRPKGFPKPPGAKFDWERGRYVRGEDADT